MAEPLKTVTSLTTVKQIDEAIAIWNKVGGGLNSAQTHIKRLQESKQKLIGILQKEYNATLTRHDSAYTYGAQGAAAYKSSLVDLMKNNYAKLSLDAYNNLQDQLNNPKKVNGEEIDPTKDGFENVIEFLEGKKGINLTSIVKTSITTAAVALMSQAGGFSLLSTVATALWTFNPVIAVCAGVVGAIAIGKLIGKVFGPELKNLTNTYRMNKAYEKVQTNNSISSFDANKIVEDHEKQQQEDQKKQQEAAEKRKEAAEKRKAINDQRTQLNKELANFKPKSIDEVVAFMGQFDKLPKADVDAAVKAAGINFEQIFKAEAADLVMAGNKNDLAKITELRTKFGSFLSAADMDKFQKDTGLKLNDKDYSQEFEDYKSVNLKEDKDKRHTPETKNKSGKNAFDTFKTCYTYVINDIFAGKNTKDVMIDIADLENFTKDPKNFSNESQDVQDKMRALCNKMIEMLKEITKAKIMGATDKDAAMKNASKEHGLDENALGDLLK